MSLYVRHSAWLNAAPERPKGDKSEAPVMSRIEAMRADRGDEDYQPDMPPLQAGGYLIGYLYEVGPVVAAGMGSAPISYQELRAWQELTRIPLQPWEVRMLRQLSREYASQSHKSGSRNCPAPWQPVDHAPDLAGVAKALKASFRQLEKL